MQIIEKEPVSIPNLIYADVYEIGEVGEQFDPKTFAKKFGYFNDRPIIIVADISPDFKKLIERTFVDEDKHVYIVWINKAKEINAENLLISKIRSVIKTLKIWRLDTIEPIFDQYSGNIQVKFLGHTNNGYWDNTALDLYHIAAAFIGCEFENFIFDKQTQKWEYELSIPASSIFKIKS